MMTPTAVGEEVAALLAKVMHAIGLLRISDEFQDAADRFHSATAHRVVRAEKLVGDARKLSEKPETLPKARESLRAAMHALNCMCSG